jgi:hypothetical protein
LIWIGLKVWEKDNGDNFSITSILIFIGIFSSIAALIYLTIHRKENGTPLFDIGSIIILIIPFILFAWNIKRVFSTNNFFLAILILFYQLILIAIAPILIIVIIWAISSGKKLIISTLKSEKKE